MVIGFLRTIGTENYVGRFLSIDIDAENFDTKNDDLVRGIVEDEIALQGQRADGESEDRGFVWQDNCMWISRVVPDAKLEPYAETIKTSKSHGTELLPLDIQKPVCAACETPDLLSSLYLRPYTGLWQLLSHDYIEVKVGAAGLNWKDLSLMLSRFDANINNLSSEYAGIVTRLGANVAGLSVIVRIYGVGKGHFGKYTHVPLAFARKLRPSDDLVEVAEMPPVYMTSVYALNYVRCSA